MVVVEDSFVFNKNLETVKYFSIKSKRLDILSEEHNIKKKLISNSEEHKKLEALASLSLLFNQKIIYSYLAT